MAAWYSWFFRYSPQRKRVLASSGAAVRRGQRAGPARRRLRSRGRSSAGVALRARSLAGRRGKKWRRTALQAPGCARQRPGRRPPAACRDTAGCAYGHTARRWPAAGSSPGSPQPSRATPGRPAKQAGSRAANVRTLHFEDAVYTTLIKARNWNTYIYSRESTQDYPDFYLRRQSLSERSLPRPTRSKAISPGFKGTKLIEYPGMRGVS